MRAIELQNVLTHKDIQELQIRLLCYHLFMIAVFKENNFELCALISNGF